MHAACQVQSFVSCLGAALESAKEVVRSKCADFTWHQLENLYIHTLFISTRNNQRSFWICVWGMIIGYANVFEKLRFQNVFRPHEHEKPLFSNFSGLKSVFEKLRFRDGLVWMVGLYRNKAAFSNIPSETGRCLILALV